MGIYVITTNGQLNIMRRQLKEMEFSRNLQTQPLPIIKDIECFVKPPKLFFEGCSEKEELAISTRIYIKGIIENIGIGAAVAIDFSPILICKYPNGKRIEDIFTRIDFLQEHGTYEFNEWFNTEDEILENFLECSVSTLESLPTFELTIYYKNVLGAFFKATYKYRIYPFEEDEEIIKKWLKKIKMFDIDFSTKRSHYNSLVKINPKEADIIFTEIESEFEKDMETSNLDADPYLIPGSFKVMPISDEESEVEFREKEIFYGRCLGSDKKSWLEKKNEKLSVKKSNE